MSRTRNSGTRAYVYIIGWSEAGPVKIGYATTVLFRLKTLQTSCPYPLKVWSALRVDRAAVLERTCHKALKDRALLGEWFDLTAREAIQHLEELAASHGGSVKYWNDAAHAEMRQLLLSGLPLRSARAVSGVANREKLAKAKRQEIIKAHSEAAFRRRAQWVSALNSK